VEQHHPKDQLTVDEFLMLRKQVVTKPAAPLTVASSADDDDDDDTSEATGADLTDEPPPGVDDQTSSETSLHATDNKSKVCTVYFSAVRILEISNRIE